ncbi:MAG: hypothetical protein ACLPKB_32015 [Xanthobacteraceae bacterium]
MAAEQNGKPFEFADEIGGSDGAVAGHFTSRLHGEIRLPVYWHNV